ncbi:hypothetical protein EJ03DRAFT_346761 [Teratosphaeria nubilosa]|uniref:Uncharacterized protein n=1 Tax=Teratosphaeria nubilosa TaxID=161662 RepID=A0A6G1LPN5_9PEZI|nr:hypothetical protein EJ03DRAFT_346761 [Teratosphaeria nubilosa]
MKVPQDSQLLALPLELRNSIYELVLGNFDGLCDKVTFVNGRVLTSSFALDATCRQIRGDMLALRRHAIRTAPEIKATITNFGFDGLTRLYRQLWSLPRGRRRKVNVTVNLIRKPQFRLGDNDKIQETDAVQKYAQPLQDWLRHCIMPEDSLRGTRGCEITYAVRVDRLRWQSKEVTSLAWNLGFLVRSMGWERSAAEVAAAVIEAEREWHRLHAGGHAFLLEDVFLHSLRE